MSAQSASALATVVVPLLAIKVMGVGAASITLMSTATACVSVVVSLPAGLFSEFRRKRPILVFADGIRFAGFVSLSVAFQLNHLVFAHLVVVLCVNAVMQILFGSASMAHTKDLLPERLRGDALGKLQSASWVAMIGGPVVAGLLVPWMPSALLLALIALCFLGSSVGVACIRKPEGDQPIRVSKEPMLRGVFSGIGFFFSQPTLRRVLVSWLLFAGAVAALTPVTQVFFLKNLRFTATQYGVAEGLPSVAALAGSWVGGRVLHRFGTTRTIVVGSLLRIPFYLLYPILPPGTKGLIGSIVAFSGILFISSIVNTGLAKLRMDFIPDRLLSRCSAAWLMTTSIAGPVLIPVAGAIMTATSPRLALLCIAVLVAVSVLVLPMRAPVPRQG